MVFRHHGELFAIHNNAKRIDAHASYARSQTPMLQ